jgi:cell pole-organizing protein PopZ
MSNDTQSPSNAHPDMSMDEVLASIRKIITTDHEAADAQAQNSASRDDEIIELTNEIAEEPSNENEYHSDEASFDPKITEEEYIFRQETVSVQNTPHLDRVSFDQSLLSEDASNASRKALDDLAKTLEKKHEEEKHQKPSSDNGLEALVLGALKPMLKEWINAHLPRLVEQIVQQEIQKLTKK